MVQYGKFFLIGVICTLVTGVAMIKIFNLEIPNHVSTPAPTALTISPDTVVIDRLPSYRTLSGINVAFNGKQKFPQTISTHLIKNLVITSFRATGENAHKSSIKITWEDGTIETVPAGSSNLRFPPEKRAKEVIVFGYSVRERQIFHDTSKPGVLNWEMFYESIEE